MAQMRSITLRTIDTEWARRKADKATLPFRTDDEQYNPTHHEPQPFHYKENLRGVLNRPINPQQGVTPEDFDDAIRLLRELKALANGDDWLLTEPDHTFIVKRLDAFPWPAAELWFWEFKNDVKNCPKVDVAAVEKNGKGEMPDNIRELVKT